MRKKIICSLLSLGMVLQYILSPDLIVFAQQDGFQEFVQGELTTDATKYIESELENIQQVLITCENDFGIEEKVVDNLELANPFVIYDVQDDTQEKCIYYPLVNSRNKKIVAIIALVKTTVSGWQYTISRNWAARLNEINYLDKDYLFYKSEGNIVVESEDAKYPLNAECIDDDFEDLPYEKKEQEIKEKMTEWEELDVKGCVDYDEKTKYGYSPSTYAMTDGVYCKLKNAQGKEWSLTRCWAAAVATVVNYRLGTDHTAKDVANKMGVSGVQDITVINKSIRKYGFDYLVMNRKPDFTLVKSSVKKKWPMVIGGRDKDGAGHAVTIYGYRENSGKSYVMIWDTDGWGSTSIATYKSSGLVFNSAGSDYVTEATSYYRKALSYK